MLYDAIYNTSNITMEESMKTCPHCGAQISEASKFCSECGYNFNGSAQPAKAQTNKLWIKFIPNLLFLVFALSLFGVFAESVISGISANVYLLCDSAIIHDSSLSIISVLSILLVIFAVFTVIAAVVTAAVKYVAYKNGKPINCKTDWISFACYVLYFLVGFIMCVVIASHQALYVGACPVWLIILPIIFTCLLGAYCAYIKYGATPVIAYEANSDNTPSNNGVEKAERKEASVKKEKSDSEVVARPKKSKALLPAILLLVVAAAMWALYMLPSIKAISYWYDYWQLNIYELNTGNIQYETLTRIFQYVFIGYLAIVTIMSVVLLIWSTVRAKKDGDAVAKVCGKSLLVTLISYGIYFAIALAWLLFTMMVAWFDIGCIAIISVAAIGLIGTIIAMVKFKKKLKQQATNSLE